MNEKEIQERMNEIKEEIKSRQEDLNDIITPGAYFYDTEEAQRLQDEIDQLQEEYSKLENTPTAEKVEELIKLFEERIEQLREEEKDFYENEQTFNSLLYGIVYCGHGRLPQRQ